MATVTMASETGEISRITLFVAYDSETEKFSKAYDNADDALYEVGPGWCM